MQDHIMQVFAYQHLPEPLQVVAQQFSAMAHTIAATLPRNPERSATVRKLLEAKDAAVRAKLAVDVPVEAR